MRSGRTEHTSEVFKSSRARVWVAGAVALVVVMAFAVVGLWPLTRGRDGVERVRGDDHTLGALANARSALADFQTWIEPVIFERNASIESASQGTTLYNELAKRTDTAVKALESIGMEDSARDLRAQAAAFSKTAIALEAKSAAATDESAPSIFQSESPAFSTFWQSLSDVTARLELARDGDSRTVTDQLGTGRNLLLATCAIAMFSLVVAALVGGQRARRRQRHELTSAQLTAYESELQDGLEMSKTEADAYTVCSLALEKSVGNLGVQMLLADSSRAHFNEVLGSDASGDADRSAGGCGVMSPVDCPAAARGHTLVFADSRAISACPHLRNRLAGDCSAACVPISIAGTTVGVTHAWGEAGTAPDRTQIGFLEIASRRTSERLSMLRAFAKSETQARNDPLTGLWNRRSLENRVHELQQEGADYAVAYGDLDRFKHLNDTHGHGTGDRALRLFSRVLRDSIRPDDLAARYGGEEFIIVLPDTDTLTARQVLERIRERLALALTSGRVPSFTVSFGLASSLDADSFDDIVSLADTALLAAKGAGRNRVVTTDDVRDGAESSERPASSRNAVVPSA